MMLFALFLSGLAAVSGAPARPVAAVGVHSFVMADRARRDPLSPAHARQWNVDFYYPARSDNGKARRYAPDATLIERLIETGYYDVPASRIRAWATKQGPARTDVPADTSREQYALVVIAPGSGVAAFNYSELAASLVKRGYAVAVVDLPYVGISRLPDGRVLASSADPVQQDDDPVSWRPRVREWAADISQVVDRLLASDSTALPAGLEVDPRRIVVTGHSLGGTVALQVCHDDVRVEGCGDFEGAPMASDVFDEGSDKPLFVTAARSAKPGRPFEIPDLGSDFWSYLRRDGPSAWAIAITRASHMSYSDAPFEMPETLSRFGGELMTPERSFSVYTGIVDAFARAYAPDGGGNQGFGKFLDATPEILARRNSGLPANQPD